MKEFSKIYCDFDGTISKKDTVCGFLELYADKMWLEVEEEWKNHRISSKECLEQQVALVTKLGPDKLNQYIESIEVDDYFLEFYEYLKSKNIELIVLSDGFELFIKSTLDKYGITDIKYYANELLHEDNSFKINFPNHNLDCKVGAGSCKCSKVKEDIYCYIGDGLSDACVAKRAKKIFAKGNLKKFCEKMNLEYISFNSFKDILDFCRRGEIDAAVSTINH